MEEVTKVYVNVSQKKIECAVRDLVRSRLPQDAMDARLQAHEQKLMKKLDQAYADRVKEIELVKYTQQSLTQRLLQRIERMQDFEVRNAIKIEVEKQIRESIDVAVHHIVKTGIEVQLGSGSRSACKLKVTEENTKKGGV